MIVLIVFGCLLSLCVAMLCYASDISDIVKVLAISLSLGIMISSITVYSDMLGAPIKHMPPDGFIYVHHVTTAETIDIWAYTKSYGHRLYEIPYNRQTAEALQGAQEKSGEGTPQVGNMDGNGTGEMSESLEFDDWQADDLSIDRKDT